MLLHDRNDDSQLLEQELFRNNINIFCQYLVNNNQTIGMVFIIKVTTSNNLSSTRYDHTHFIT